MKGLFEWAALLFFPVAFGLLFLCFIFGFMPNYSQGERVGVVTKLSKKGIVFKSWEGSLNEGGVKRVSDGESGYNVVPNAVGFNVQKALVIDQIRTAYESGKPVRLTYSQYLIKPIKISHSRVITKVEKLEKD